MNEVSRRPFYGEYAWAFDLLIDRPVRKECAVIAAWLIDRSIRPGAEVLDAGCGTGRYAIELARRGYVVQGMDRSPDLIEVATRAAGDSTGRVSFTVGDIARLPAARYAAILCRGVLNDVTDDAGRDAVFAAFSEALQSDGVLILDVRDWEASVERKTREPLFRKRVSTDQGELTFTSVTALDPENRQLLISERHELIGPSGERASDYHFVMRCWDQAELDMMLARHGFGKISYFGAYDSDVSVGTTDRLVVVAQRRNRGRPQRADVSNDIAAALLRACFPGRSSSRCGRSHLRRRLRLSPSRHATRRLTARRFMLACGVTPQAVLMEAQPEFAITHSPGCMFVTDRPVGDAGGPNE